MNNISNEINKVRENRILEDILIACHNMQEDITFIKGNDENKRTRQKLIKIVANQRNTNRNIQDVLEQAKRISPKIGQ